MKKIKHLLLFVGTALFLAACGTGGNGGDTGDQTGTLAFALNGVESASVTVTATGADTPAFTGTVSDGDTETLNVGDYTVVGVDTADFNAPAAETVTVSANETTTVTLNYTADDNGDDGDNGDNGDNDDAVTEAGVHVRVFPPEARAGATVSVIDVDGETVASESGSTGTVHFDDLEAAEDLRVQVSNADWTTWTSDYFDFEVGDTEDFRATLGLDGSVVGNIARDGITFDFGDVDGNRFDTELEDNPAKVATLLGAQTEEQICVTVNVADAAGNPVRNAPVSVGFANDFWDAAIAYEGGCENELSAATASGLEELYTNGDGDVTFSMQLLNAGPLVWQTIFTGEREPVKVLVSAVGADGVAQSSEFKVFGINMSHLVFEHGDVVDDVDGPIVDDWVEAGLAETRFGHDFGVITNIWQDGGPNGHAFWTGAYVKQPSSGPYSVPNDDFGNAGYHPGYVEYELLEGSDVDSLVWTGCDATPSGNCLVQDHDDTYAYLTPAPGVSVEDLPLVANVRATYFFQIVYGGEVYTFELKDYTFTKTWVGGFLEVDKYVTQHVLTWHGEDVTLPASDQTGYTAPGDDYRSTAVITVSNPSESTIYNVTVTDGVPAELGVVTGSISHGGTYSPVQHTVTWNNIPELAALEPGDEVVFTFEVYARHKPGYCWDGGDTGLYSAPELHYFNAQTTFECWAHDDPYDVTNGSSPRGDGYRTVTAAGFFEDGVGGQQHVYPYVPQADESTIWVVRPFFEIMKELQSSETMALNAAATFRIQARQLNRVSTVAPDATHTAYASLANLYPWEFDWFTPAGAGTGHRAPESVERDNPYARDVVVVDAYEVGLDFTQGLEFNGLGIIPTPTNVQGQQVTFQPIASLHPSGTAMSAFLTLQGVLHSENLNGTAANGATFQLDDETFAWRNCAFLGAPQLNQPAYGADGLGSLLPRVYGHTDPVRYTGGMWNSPADAGPEGWPQAEFSPIDLEGHARVSWLSSCDVVAVIEPEPLPILGLNVNGEHEGFTGPDHAQWGVQENVYRVGEDWTYIYSFNNSGGSAATNATVTLAQQNSNTRFAGNVQVWASPDGTSGSWVAQAVPGDYQTPTNDNSTKVLTFASVGAGEYIRVAVPGYAVSAGDGAVVFSITYDGGTAGPSTDDTTTIP